MENGIPSANGRFLAAERLPGEADARLESSLVKLQTDAPVGEDTVGAPADRRTALGLIPLETLHVVIRHAIADLGLGCGQSPCQSNVDGKVARDAPIILNERTNQLPAAARGRAEEGLIMGGENAGAAKQ